MGKIMILGAFVLMAIWLMWALHTAPRCVCGQSDCGGGCGLC